MFLGQFFGACKVAHYIFGSTTLDVHLKSYLVTETLKLSFARVSAFLWTLKSDSFWGVSLCTREIKKAAAS